MIKELWWKILTILQAIFTAPKYTKLEEELMRENAALHNSLQAERERFNDMVERTLFPQSQPAEPVFNFQPVGGHKTWANRKQELEAASKQRAAEEYVKRTEAELAKKGISLDKEAT